MKYCHFQDITRCKNHARWRFCASVIQVSVFSLICHNLEGPLVRMKEYLKNIKVIECDNLVPNAKL